MLQDSMDRALGLSKGLDVHRMIQTPNEATYARLGEKMEVT
jgi:hypothetical protein